MKHKLYKIGSYVKVKHKEHDTKAQRGSGVIALLFL